MDDRSVASRPLRWGGLTLATVLVNFVLAAFGPKLVAVLQRTGRPLPNGGEWKEWIMIAMFATCMAGHVVGWWLPLWGGLLVIVAACIVSVPLALQWIFGPLILGGRSSWSACCTSWGTGLTVLFELLDAAGQPARIFNAEDTMIGCCRETDHTRRTICYHMDLTPVAMEVFPVGGADRPGRPAWVDPGVVITVDESRADCLVRAATRSVQTGSW